MSIVLSITITIIIIIIFLFLNNSISFMSLVNREKMTPFECGFDPLSSSRIPYSIHFFIVSVMFLIFDLEIVLLIPFIIKLYSLSIEMLISFMIIILILIFGIYLEMLENSIEWIYN